MTSEQDNASNNQPKNKEFLAFSLKEKKIPVS